MFKKLTVLLIIALFSSGCDEMSKSVQNNQNLQNDSISKEQKAESAKFIFDAVDLLGKNHHKLIKYLVNQKLTGKI